MLGRVPVSVVVGVVLGVIGGVYGPPVAASAATCSGAMRQDFDGDGHADLVVARTMPTTSAGVVDIVMSGGSTQTISAATLGYESTANDQFGAAITIATIEELDSCPDLVVGAPGTVGGGAVYLVRGNGQGVATTASRVVSPQAGARFGATVAAPMLSRMHLIVGAPGLDVNGVADAGGIVIWPLAQGTSAGSPTTFTYTDFGAKPAAKDHLGAVMDVSTWHVTLGVPDRDVSGAADAGEVVSFNLDDYIPDVIAVRDITRANQNRRGAPGVAEPGDHFGASVDFKGYVYAGIPGEDIGGRRDVGAVASYQEGDRNTTAHWRLRTQDSPGVPGVNEAGDQFGAALHTGWTEIPVGDEDESFPAEVLVIGSPGEDIGHIRNAGGITVMIPSWDKAFFLRQGAGLPGQAERGDRVGAAFGDFPGEYFGPYLGGDGIVVGAPGEDIGSTGDAGQVMYARGLAPKGTFTWTTATNLGATVAGGQYGWTLPAVSSDN